MRKLQAFYQFVNSLDLVPTDKIHAFVDSGSIHYGAVAPEADADHVLRYTGTLILEEFTGNPNVFLGAVVYWLSANDPHRDRDGMKSPEFEAEILDAHASDLGLSIEFTEDVQFVPGDMGPSIQLHGSDLMLEPLPDLTDLHDFNEAVHIPNPDDALWEQ